MRRRVLRDKRVLRATSCPDKFGANARTMVWSNPAGRTECRMDGSRFDSLVKDFGRVRSRRGLLGALTAAAVSAVALGRDKSNAAPSNGNNRCKDRGRPCAHDDNCCFGVCCNKTCCDEGQICNGAFCVAPPTPTSTPTNTPTVTPTNTPGPICTAACGVPGECGGGCVCAQSVEGNAFCVSPSAGNCSAPCTSSAECGGGFCATSVCCGSPMCVPVTNVCAS